MPDWLYDIIPIPDLQSSSSDHEKPLIKFEERSNDMSTTPTIPKNPHDIVPGKDKSIAQIDKTQRQQEAAIEIQKTYRKFTFPVTKVLTNSKDENPGQMKPSERWTEALKRAKLEATISSPRGGTSKHRRKWKNAKTVITGLQNDDWDSTEESMSEGDDEDSDEEERKRRRQELERLKKDKTNAKVMESPYFLEMIDPHHRYGSNLRAYHSYWLRHTNNKDNFFQWLDEGEGLNVDLADQGRSRESLDTEKVRYLTREQRAHYLVRIDENGLLRWAKNGNLIDTTTEFTDSEEGIVRVNDNDANVPSGEEASTRSTSESDANSSTSGSSAVSGTERADKYVNDKKGIKKLCLISPQAVMSRLLRKTTRKNTWIYVTDAKYRLYVGLKQSGSFQHSSFLHGSRVTSAGLITVRQGQLRKLSPLSGHYRCATKHFRRFLHEMENQKVDLSKVHISRSYTIMIGMETIGHVRKVKSKFASGVENLVDKSKEKIEARKDSKSNGINEEETPSDEDAGTLTEEMEKITVNGN